MKNIVRYALLFALAGGAALFTGCRADEKVGLAGYPQTPVGATISGTSDRVAVSKATYDGDGALNVEGSLSGEYTIALAQASPEDVTVRVEPIITNVPAELVEISASELVIPAGSRTASVSVTITEEDYGFMDNVPQSVTYELGVRVVEARGSQVPVVDGEAKMVIEKEAYMAAASLVGIAGNELVITRNYVDGQILDEDPMACEVKVVTDRPVLEDTKFVVRSAGIPEGFADDESFSPAAEVTILAGEKESSATTWTLANDFLEVDDVLGTFPMQLSIEMVGESATAVVDPEDAGVAIQIVKMSDLVKFLAAADASWTKLPTDGWTVESNGHSYDGYDVNTLLFDGSTSSEISGNPLEIIIDMKVSQKVVGFSVTCWGNFTYMGKSFECSTSEDGVNWKLHGELMIADAPNNAFGATNYVQLTPCNARYVKWVGVADESSSFPFPVDISEFYIYGKN
ncbi:DUF4989 domain-containing protein [uncultured Alistipes sp.]|uniref:DUF4989 domain-containing protein n=1 Tax=uncultured Alistipes sp. TaxID=538949 RepID=UPI00272C4803|nr:DUF4989 domain-containing protein [uncultured Alistipes sp.]